MRILVTRTEPPWPLCYGGRLHGYEMCRRLAERHQLVMATERPGPAPETGFNFECRVLEPDRTSGSESDSHASIGLTRVDRFFGINPRFTMALSRLADRWQPDVVIGMGYLSLAHLARLPEVPTVCDLGDDEALHRLLELRHGRLTGKWHDLKCLAAAALYQRRHLRRVDAVTVLSEADRRFCRWHTGHRRVECIPHGVDCEHYRPRGEPTEANRIIFWGSLGFGPNVSALLFFAQRVWPRIRHRCPDARWTILGRGHSAALEPIRHRAGIDFIGPVEDIRTYAASAAVVVVPMLSGAGIKNKIMEAWALGKAVVCTPRALGSLPGDHGRNVWVGRSPRALAEGVIRILEDGAFRGQLEHAARRTALERCSWDRAADQLEDLCAGLVSRRGAPQRCFGATESAFLPERC